MNRRNFLKKAMQSSVALSIHLSTGSFVENFGQSKTSYDIVAVKGGEPDVMFERGIKYIGGIKAFVSKGQKVVVKPNIGWDAIPERGANTHPKLISQIVKQCFNAGAKEVYVLDHTCDEWTRCYKNSGIEKAAKNAGAKVVPANSESYYHQVDIPLGKTLKTAKEHEIILNSDVFINVPILKSHSGTTLTIAMKNLMGNVWDRRYWHRTDLHQCIADFATYRKPHLNVVDAYYVMMKNGPRGVSIEDVVTLKALLISTNIVAVDAAAAKLFGIEPEQIKYINLATEMKVGRKDLDNLNIKRITL